MLRFSFAGIPVGVQPFFWVLALLLGFGTFDGVELVLWIAIVFVSVLVHELGHAFTARAFGMRPSIVLHAFGGLTQWAVEEELSPRKRVSITLAGPLAGFALAGAAWLLFHYTALGDSDRGVRLALGVTIWVNLIWGVFNLVPIRGLDGGQTVNGLLDWLIPKQSRVVAEVIFVATGAAAVIYGLVAGFPLVAFFAVFLTIGPYLDGSRARTPRRPPAAPAEAPDEQSPEPRGQDGPTLGI